MCCGSRSSSPSRRPGCVHSTACAASAWLYARGLHRAVRHAVVHLPAADLLRGREARTHLGVPPVLIWLVGAALEIAHIQTGWTVIDEFASRFVYFYAGYVLCARIFPLAARRRRGRGRGCGACRSGASSMGCWCSRPAELPFVSLTLGLAGATAVISVSALMAKHDCSSPALSAGKTRSSSIWPSSCRWRSRARCCSRPAGSPDVGTISLHRHASGGRRAGRLLGGAQAPSSLPVRAAGTLLDRAKEAARAAAGAVTPDLSPRRGWRLHRPD